MTAARVVRLIVLAAFVAGIFVGAGWWFPLVVIVATVAAWRWLEPPART